MKRALPSTVKNVASTAKKQAGHWSLGLLATMNDPESVLEEDDQIIVIKDKYPKSHFHYLVLPKKDISSISKITKDDLELLKYMEDTGNKYAAKNDKYEFL